MSKTGFPNPRGKNAHGVVETLPEKQLTSWPEWRELIYDLMHQQDVEIGNEAAFWAKIRHEQRGDLFVAQGSMAPHSVWRSKQAIRQQPSDMITVVVKHTGTAGLTLGDDEALATPGSVLVLDLNLPIHSNNLTTDVSSWTAIHLDRAPLEDAISQIGSINDLVIDPDQPSARVLKSYIQSLSENLSDLSDVGGDSFKNVTVELVRNALVLSTQDYASQYAKGLHRVQKAILKRIRDPNFNLDEVACEVGIGKRTIYRMFQSVGTTPSKWVEARRLELIARELRSPASTGRNISQIALATGYNELAHLSRVFKRRYGVSPSKFRKRAR